MPFSVLNLNAAHALSGSEEQIESAIEAAVANGWGKKFQTNIGDEAAQLGNKTKSQLIAEQNIFKQLIITVIAAKQRSPTVGARSSKPTSAMKPRN